jgi:hypothetical protein
MAFKRLTTGEMAQLSAPWVSEGSEARKAILATLDLAPLLPKLEAAHKALRRRAARRPPNRNQGDVGGCLTEFQQNHA